MSESEDSDVSDSNSECSSHATRPGNKSRSVSLSKSKPRSVSLSKSKHVTKPANKASQLRKASTQPQASDASTTSRSDTARNLIMPKGGNKLNVLPSIILSSKAEYLTTIFNALDASESPFDDFAKSSPHFLKISRRAFRNIWPHIDITLETDDVLFNVVGLFSLLSDLA